MALIRTLLTSTLLALLLSAEANGQDRLPDLPPSVPEELGAGVMQTTLADTDPDALQLAFRRMKRDETIQFDLRTETEAPPPPPPRWMQRLGEFFGKIFEILVRIFIPLFWIGVGALVMVLLYAVVLGLMGLKERLQPGEEDAVGPVPEYRPDDRTVRVLLSEADRLAAEGRYAEAVHLLLFRSIQDIEQVRPDIVRLSLTSREIARSSALGPMTRTTFAELARMVERSHFGGRSVDAQDYASARATYERFAAPTNTASPATPPAGLPA